MDDFSNKCSGLNFGIETSMVEYNTIGSFRRIRLINQKNNRSMRTESSVMGNLYFEIVVIQPVVRIGLCTEKFDSRGPVGTTCSWGYGSVKGYKYHMGKRHFYYERFSCGDVISVLKYNNTLKFYKNGRDGGIAYENLPDTGYYPCISFYKQDASADVNFGPCFNYFDSVMKQEGFFLK